MSQKYSLWHIPKEVWLKLFNEPSTMTSEQLEALRLLKKEDISNTYRNKIDKYLKIFKRNTKWPC